MSKFIVVRVYGGRGGEESKVFTYEVENIKAVVAEIVTEDLGENYDEEDAKYFSDELNENTTDEGDHWVIWNEEIVYYVVEVK